MKAYEMQARARHQRGEPLHELHRQHHDVSGAVAVRCPFDKACPELVEGLRTGLTVRTTCPARFTLKRSLAMDGRVT